MGVGQGAAFIMLSLTPKKENFKQHFSSGIPNENFRNNIAGTSFV